MNGASNPAPAGEATEGYLPHTDSHALGACGCGNRPRATLAINVCHGCRAHTLPWRHGQGMKKVERKRNGKGEKRGARFGRRWASRPGCQGPALTTPCCSTGNVGPVLRGKLMITLPAYSHCRRTHALLVVTLPAYSRATRSHTSGVLMRPS